MCDYARFNEEQKEFINDVIKNYVKPNSVLREKKRFRFTTKDWVVQQYVKFGIMDLFNITRSCEGEFSTINYLTYAPNDPVPTCGECFWCKEREWAVRSALQ